MAIVLDLIASMAVRGAIVYIVLTMNISLHELLFEKAQYAIIKQNTATIVDIIRNDLRAAGYNVTSGSVFESTDPKKIEFNGDADNDGTPERIRYFYKSKDELLDTPNPDDRILYREKDGGTDVPFGYGVTDLSITYYDVNGVVTTNKDNVRSLSLKLVMQGGHQINGYYPTSIWETHFFPSNM